MIGVAAAIAFLLLVVVFRFLWSVMKWVVEGFRNPSRF
jgi:hypothetical protein